MMMMMMMMMMQFIATTMGIGMMQFEEAIKRFNAGKVFDRLFVTEKLLRRVSLI
jgi:hypothetical protein